MNADSQSLEVRDAHDATMDQIVQDLQSVHHRLSARLGADFTLAHRLAAIRAAVDAGQRVPPPRPRRPGVAAVARRIGSAVGRRAARWGMVAMRSIGGRGRPGDRSEDVAWLADLWDNHGQDVARFVARQIDNESTVDDLVQQTYVAAWQQREQRQQILEPRAWLFGVAKNHIRRYWQGRRREHETWQNHLVLAPLSSDGGILETELAVDLTDALRRLTRQESECILLAVRHGLNDTEIAALQRTSPANVRQRRHRARWKLYEALGDRAIGVIVSPRPSQG